MCSTQSTFNKFLSYGRDRVSSAFFEGVGHFEAKLLGWRVTARTNIYGPLDTGMVVLQLCRWKFSRKETS